MNFFIYVDPLLNISSGEQSPWSTAHFFNPSNSYSFPFFWTKAMKCESTSDWTADCPSWEALLCSLFMSLFFSKISPIYLESLANAWFLNLVRKLSGTTISGWDSRALRMIWKRAMVPHALWANCFIKNTLLGIDPGLRLCSCWFLNYFWTGVC